MGIKWISNWNDPATTLWPEPYTQRLTNREYAIARKYESACLLNSDAITFPAETLASIFKKEYPFLSNKTCVIIPHIALINTLLKEQKHIKDGLFRICHSGNLSIERNPENLFKAIREIIDEHTIQMRFDIMGYANDFTQSLVSKYRLNDIVNFIGGHPYIEAMNLLPYYDVLVLIEAILDYGMFFPSKLVDYAQSKRPILAISPSKGYVADKIKKKGGGIVVDNTDYREIKIALWNMYQKWETNTLQDSYSTDGLLEDYSTDKVIELYRSLFRQLGISN
jgi:glycosyltransferase involved in cell wall biosynthesis